MTNQDMFLLEQENKHLARRILEETINARNLDSLSEPLGADYICQALPGHGSEAYRQHVDTMLKVNADLRVHVDGQIAEGELVATCFTATGTHAGEWQNMAPTQR